MIKKVHIRNQTVDLKYCDTCRIYRPPRASHCRQCDNCVGKPCLTLHHYLFFQLSLMLMSLIENEDHHCVWLNNCIGRRNYRSFFIFINTASILCLYTLICSIVHVVSLYLVSSSELNFLNAIQQAPVSFALIILCFLLIWSVGGLTGYHCYLALNGVTTHEQVRLSYKRLPFVCYLLA